MVVEKVLHDKYKVTDEEVTETTKRIKKTRWAIILIHIWNPMV